MEEESKKIENPALKIVDGHAVKDPKDYQDPDELYDVLIERIRQYHPSADLTIVQKAYQLAKDAHEGQFRKSGEPYIIHPLWVGIILANLELDKETIVAGILHDVVEDTVMTSEEIAAQFGEEVALLVEGVTKIGQLSYSKDKDKLEMQAETLRKMFLAMSKDIRVILIKLADRLHNMRTLHFLQKPEKRARIAKETLDIYAPLAERIGMQEVKSELEEIAFANEAMVGFSIAATSFAADIIVIDIFVPVSPSGTGNTFSSLIHSFLASKLLAPARNILAKSSAFIVVTSTFKILLNQ